MFLYDCIIICFSVCYVVGKDIRGEWENCGVNKEKELFAVRELTEQVSVQV